MSDAELAAAVGDASGRVFIGFKAPAGLEGVDETGNVLVSAAVVGEAKALLRAAGAEIRIEYDLPFVAATIPRDLVARLRSNPIIEYIEPIFPGTFLVQDTTWNVQRVQAPPAWSYSTGAGAKLLILDSGVQPDHPDLAPAVINGSCDRSDGFDTYGHGTSVAGIGAAINNSIQIIGVAHGVALWTSRIGQYSPSADYVACGVQFGRTNRVAAINISAAMNPSTSLTDQINTAYYQDGIVIVAAAGNTNGGSVTYPATLDAVMAVTATDAQDNRASFAAVGSKIELAAPGADVVSTCLGGATCTVSGTSFAAPHVAAAAALLKAYNPSWSAAEIRRRLDVSATDLGASGRDPEFGYGLLNVRGAINAPPPLSVSLAGPGTITAPGSYTWSATVSGGTGSYKYRWQYLPDNTANWITMSSIGPTTSRYVDETVKSFQWRVTVTSGLQQSVAGMRVFNQLYDPTCGGGVAC